MKIVEKVRGLDRANSTCRAAKSITKSEEIVGGERRQESGLGSDRLVAGRQGTAVAWRYRSKATRVVHSHQRARCGGIDVCVRIVVLE
jgi:hypothetical protein